MLDLDKINEIIEKICERVEPGKKMIQKLLYLMERKEVELNLNYCIHFFGPYSSKLDNVLHALESRDRIKIKKEGLTHIVNIEERLETKKLNPEEIKNVEFVLDNFYKMSAKDLEAITTIDYVAKNLLKNNYSDSEIIDKVKSIKGSKFNDTVLNNKLQLLKELKFLN